MISPTAWLERLARELAVARAGDDPEGVHQMRVAAGRLGVWLELGGWRVLRDDLRWLRRSASGVRDLDVLIAGGGDAEHVRWLEARRVSARRELSVALDDECVEGLLTALARMPALPRSTARDRLRTLKDRALRASAALEHDRSDLHAWHRLRRALRRLRYALEWLGEDAQALEAFQDVLGELNNRVVAARHLREFRGDGARTEAVDVLERSIDAQCAIAAEHWVGLREQIEAS